MSSLPSSEWPRPHRDKPPEYLRPNQGSVRPNNPHGSIVHSPDGNELTLEPEGRQEIEGG